MQNVAFGLMLLALIGFVFGLLGIIAHDRLLSWTPGRMGGGHRFAWAGFRRKAELFGPKKAR